MNAPSLLRATGIPLAVRSVCRVLCALTHPVLVTGAAAGLFLAGFLWAVSWWGGAVAQRQQENAAAIVEHNEALSRRAALQEQIDWEVRQHRLDPTFPYPEQVPACPPWQEPWVLSVSTVGEVEARCQ